MNIIKNNIAHTDPSMHKYGKNGTRADNSHQGLTDPCMPLLVAVLRLEGKVHHEINQVTAEVDSSNTLQQPVTQSVGLATQNIHQI